MVGGVGGWCTSSRRWELVDGGEWSVMVIMREDGGVRAQFSRIGEGKHAQ